MGVLMLAIEPMFVYLQGEINFIFLKWAFNEL